MAIRIGRPIAEKLILSLTYADRSQGKGFRVRKERELTKNRGLKIMKIDLCGSALLNPALGMASDREGFHNQFPARGRKLPELSNV